MPERAGRYPIPPLAMSYFDTASGRYRTLKTAGATARGLPGPPGRPAGAAQSRPGRRRKPSPSGRSPNWGTTSSPSTPTLGEPASGLAALPGAAVFWLLLIGPPAAFLLTLGGTVARRRSGGMIAARACGGPPAEFASACGRSGLTADELMHALQEYLSQRLSVPRGSFTADEAAALLRARGVGEKTVGELHTAWRRIEDAIYTGQGREATDAGAAFARLVARVEKELR